MPDLAVVVPTLNERGNIRPLLDKLDAALTGIDWEVVFVDDSSSDGTAAEIVDAAAHDKRVRLIERVDRRGLASACIDGMMATTASYIAVMDADLQHDERVLAEMVAALRQDPELDLVVGSRFVESGSVGDWNRFRVMVSRLGKATSKMLLPVRIADPMSGFFALRREFIRRHVENLSGMGFKILLDIILTAGAGTRIKEIPYAFGQRQYGQSKLDHRVVVEFFYLLLDKSIAKVVPLRFLMFISVGGFGLLVHLAILGGLFKWLGMQFWIAQVLAGFLTMIVNYVLNNILTFGDHRLRGWRFLRGMVVFCLLCGIGLAMNFAMALATFELTQSWVLAGVAGGLFGALWNYASNSTLNWRIIK